ncbi:hypothetical protein PRBEI_2001113200 [Prionailurus iriomotensis]
MAAASTSREENKIRETVSKAQSTNVFISSVYFVHTLKITLVIWSFGSELPYKAVSSWLLYMRKLSSEDPVIQEMAPEIHLNKLREKQELDSPAVTKWETSYYSK